MHDAAGQILHDYHEQQTEFNQMRLDRKKAERKGFCKYVQNCKYPMCKCLIERNENDKK